MDAIIGLIFGLLAAAAAFLFKEKQLQDVKAERDILDLEMQKQIKKQRVREAALITATKKEAYEQTKAKFYNQYGHLIAKPADTSADSNGEND